ncbi:hypothetical protein K445DRAFT_8492 [Daldinia sp. EC12]|nr:FabD/lysophospholipase-like protein [Daldinia eschscholtzii]OTB19456.1 hypothetical protein K445DRAFT_8492 [Daldinia sp. EC12]
MPVEIESVGHTTTELCRPLRRYQDVADEVPSSPWAKKTVLSFDGGGVRGYSSLLILKSLMLKIKEIESEGPNGRFCSSSHYSWMGADSISPNDNTLGDFLPCHYFDYIAGTSTGGLSAIMLGRLRMTVDEALRQYETFGNNVFGKGRRCHIRSRFWFPRAKYSSEKAMLAFREIIHKSMTRNGQILPEYQAEMELFPYRADRTRTVVFSLSIGKKSGIDMVYLWRSYNHETGINASDDAYKPLNASPAHMVPIWQIARATSAAPLLFEPITINNQNHFDGGLVANNPSTYVLHEVRALHGYSPKVFISIGCGLKKRGNGKTPAENSQAFDDDTVGTSKRKGGNVGKWHGFLGGVKHIMTDTEGVYGVQGWDNACNILHIEHRGRFNVEGELATIALDDWKPPKSGRSTLDKIRQETYDYLSQEAVQEKITKMARELVNIRRERAETERWESFALDVAYRCPRSSCQGQSSRGCTNINNKNYSDQTLIKVHLKAKIIFKRPSFITKGKPGIIIIILP